MNSVEEIETKAKEVKISALWRRDDQLGDSGDKIAIPGVSPGKNSTR